MKCIWFLSVVPALCWAQEALSLEQAVSIGLTSHPLVAAAQQRIAASEGFKTQAGLRPNPRAILQQENLRTSWNPAYVYGTTTDTFAYLQQTIETNGRRQKRLDLASAHISRSQLELEVLKRQIASRVRQAYWAAAGAQRIHGLLRQTLDNFRQTVEYHEIRVREGAMAESDLLRVRLEAERIRLAANNAALDAERANILLSRELGQTTFPQRNLIEQFEPKEDPLIPVDVESALSRRAEMLLARQVLTSAREAARLQQAYSRPTFDWVAGYKRTSGYDTALVGLQMDLPVSNRNQGNILASQAEIRVVEADVAATEALIRAEVASATADYQTRRQQVLEFLPKFRDQAAETARIAAAAYREGGSDLLRLLDAERLRLDVELIAYRATMEYRQSIVALQTALGVTP